MEAVGVDILTVDRVRLRHKRHCCSVKAGPGGGLSSLQLGFSSLTRVLPTDETDEVMNAGVGYRHYGHRVDFILSHLHREVDVDLLCGRCANVALRMETSRKQKQSWYPVFSLCKNI